MLVTATAAIVRNCQGAPSPRTSNVAKQQRAQRPHDKADGKYPPEVEGLHQGVVQREKDILYGASLGGWGYGFVVVWAGPLALLSPGGGPAMFGPRVELDGEGERMRACLPSAAEC
jgi:hypothetical protein